jgi:hypothetical protein
MGFKSYSIIYILLSLLFSITGCKSSSMRSVPDAPPPYPNFPVPQERFNSAQVYGGQPSNAPYVPPYSQPASSPQSATPTFYTPPPASPPSPQAFQPKPVSNYNYNRSYSQPQLQESNTQNARFTLEANAELWALVQDSKGVELEWLKMKKGDTARLHHSGALTITCSSGDQLTIKDKNLKPIQTNPNPSGISIVRLPSL